MVVTLSWVSVNGFPPQVSSFCLWGAVIACSLCRTRVLAPRDKLGNQNPVAKGWQRGQFYNISYITG